MCLFPLLAAAADACRRVGVAKSCAKFTSQRRQAGALPSLNDMSCLLKHDQFSDVDVVIRLAAQDQSSDSNDTAATTSSSTLAGKSDASRSDVDQPDNSDPTAIAEFPGHLAILCRSEYFHAQAQFVANCRERTTDKHVLTLTVDDASHVPAVEAVIAVLYGVDDSISQLSQCQLVHVVRYADMLQVESVAAEATCLLLRAANTRNGLAADALHALCQFAWPSCLLPVLPLVAGYIDSKINMSSRSSSALEVLLSVLGNLEVVWADRDISSTLLKLPLLAVEVLLSSDQLQVHSEDTVLYTAARYVAAQPSSLFVIYRNNLSELIRAPHLSDFQLAAQAVNTDTSACNVMLQHQPWLRQLITLKRLGEVRPDIVQHKLPESAKAWQLPTRCILPTSSEGVMLTWRVPLADIQAAYQTCRDKKRPQALYSSSDDLTGPICGVAWRLALHCTWDNTAQGVKVGVYAKPHVCPRDAFYKFTFEIRCPDSKQCNASGQKVTTGALKNYSGWGWDDFFCLGVLQGNWAESVWTEKGLLVEGAIMLVLIVHGVL